MQLQQQYKDRLVAGVGTAILMVLLAVWIAVVNLTVNLADIEERKWPPVDSAEIVFGGEFVKLGDIPQPMPDNSAKAAPSASTPEPAHDGTDRFDAGAPSKVAPDPIVSDRPSPMKVEKKPETPEKKGPSKEELAAERERIKRQQEQEEQSQKISSGIKNSFNRTGKPSEGTSGSPNGNSDSGVLGGTPGFNLNGRTAEVWGAARSSLAGSITIRVRVDRQGRVVGASYIGGSGPAAANSQVRNSCLSAARGSRFSVDLDAAAEQVGTITWTFR